MTEQQAAEISRRWARFHFRRMPHVKGSLEFLGMNEQERINRIETFERVIARLNELFDNPNQIPPALADVKKLIDEMHGKKIPTLTVITESPAMADAIRQTFEFGKRDFPTWADSPMRLPTMPAIGVFLEGFGYFLGKLVHGTNEELALTTKRSFVNGFEETLLVEHPESKLLDDVIDWMREEKSDFPSEIQTILTKRTS